MLDVLIQTHNEQLNLPHTLESLRGGWINRVFVVDSGSNDRTREIAEAAGATFVHHDWEGYAQQKNWALDNLPFESPWILILDADEAISPELRTEIQAIVHRPATEVSESAFYINRVFIFMGKKIRHCGYFPSWNLRLFKRGHARYEQRLVHEHMIVTGKTGYMRSLLLHEDRRGLEHFIAKHNRYSTLEAQEIYAAREEWPGVHTFLTNRVNRRRYLKNRVLPFMPLPWALRFFYMYIIKLGFLDGAAGWYLCLFISSYEFFIRMKYTELHELKGRRPVGIGGLSVAEGKMNTSADRTAQIQIAHPVAPTTPIPVLPPVKPRPDGSGAAAIAAGSGTLELDADGVAADASNPLPRVPADDRQSSIATASALTQKTSDGHILVSTRTVLHPPIANPAKVSVMIPTLNEGKNLARCLDHLRWADEVIVVDSSSKDNTVAIAQDYGATVVRFKWSGAWPKKKNWALRNVPFRNQWVLIVDADEWITPELADEISNAIKSEQHVGYYVNRRFIFMGGWIRHCGYYPSWNLRLIRLGKGEYEQLTEAGDTGSGDNEVHEHIAAQGSVGHLHNDMLHFAFPSVNVFMEKHNRYSNWEAKVQFSGADAEGVVQGSSDLTRRRKLKNLSRRLPFRPTLRFLYSYLWQRGFLDGRPGYVFCRLLAIYEYLSVAKFYELKRSEEDLRRSGQMSSVRPLSEGDGPTPHKPAKTRLQELLVSPTEDLQPRPTAERNLSPWTRKQNIQRMLWAIVQCTLFHYSLHNAYRFRAFLLRCFGAKLGRNVRIRRTVSIEIPWNLTIGDDVSIGDKAILYALGPIAIGSRSFASQLVHICAGTHDYTDRNYLLLRPPITIGEDVWLATDCFIGPGVKIGTGTVVGARSVVVKDTPEWMIVAGSPAKPIKARTFK